MIAVWILSYLAIFLIGGLSVAASFYLYFTNLEKKEQKKLDAMPHPTTVDANPFIPIVDSNPILDYS